MRKINYIVRFIPAVVITAIISIIAYVLTIICMIFVNWDLEYKSIKTIHPEMGDLFLVVLGTHK